MPDTIINAVQSLGVAAVLCLLMAYFVKYMFDKFMAQRDVDSQLYSEQISALKDAINNNTIVMAKILSTLGMKEE
ncbi:hypothetical protein CS229P3_00016 [Clostridium phage CS229P3]|nr:hypothetical protein CS229P1_00009 [Clostridium phage CS229P1]WAX12029.1 hypothetical protein CS229P2_00016 [Clostridium phage CS229P2]WAX12053.1 hypothetical protein CS229P3_00016 [Clostridium phage CS229P3]